MSTSPPITPPATSPDVDNDTGGLRMVPPCELVDDYRPGGLHPVHLGDVYNVDQYEVIRKLGEGSFSTVWLARDRPNIRYVALKILESKSSESNIELRILHHLRNEDRANKGSQRVTQLLDRFDFLGPNGVHKCLVLEPMGPSVNQMLDVLQASDPRKYKMFPSYPLWMAKGILKQALQGLEYLHEKGIAHGDFQPGNMLFTLNDIDSIPEADLWQKKGIEDQSQSPAGQGKEGKEVNSAPRYLCIAQPLGDFSNHDEGFKIKLSDMGGAYFFSDPPDKLPSPIGLRAPELILGGAVDHRKLDVWSFGCLIFELVTRIQLFIIMPGKEQDDEHLLALHTQVGPLPDEIFQRWETSHLYFSPERKLYNCQPGGVPEGEEPLMVDMPSMEALFDEHRAEYRLDFDEEEATRIKKLIRRILQYDPSKRPSPAELLSDPWFAEIDVEKGQ